MARTKTSIVAAAAKELDKLRPGWAYDVRIRTLFGGKNTSAPVYSSCVLEQAIPEDAAVVNPQDNDLDSGYGFSYYIERQIGSGLGEANSPFWPLFALSAAEQKRLAQLHHAPFTDERRAEKEALLVTAQNRLIDLWAAEVRKRRGTAGTRPSAAVRRQRAADRKAAKEAEAKAKALANGDLCQFGFKRCDCKNNGGIARWN